MKKIFTLFVLLLTAVFAFSEEYKVVSVSGQAYFKEKDEWKKLEPEMVLEEDTVIKTSLNTEIVLSYNNQTVKIPSAKNDITKNLVQDALSSKSTKIKKTGEIKKSKVDVSETKKKKRVSTAAERADPQNEDLELEDDEEYVEITEQDLKDLKTLEEMDNADSN